MGPNPYSIDLMDNGVLRTFDFRGGVNHPVFIPPSYTTNNPHEQELLESYPMFRITFRVGTVTEEEEVPGSGFRVPGSKKISGGQEAGSSEENTASTEAQDLASQQEEGKAEQNEADTNGPKVFKNAQEAKNWLIKEKKVAANAVRNKELMMAKAKEMGIDLILESDINN